MAQQIDIPGIGTVTAENFAQEDTLQQILAAITKVTSAKKKDTSAQEVQDKKLLVQRKKEIEASKDVTEANKAYAGELDDLMEEFDKQAKQMGKWTEPLKNMGATLKDGAYMAMDILKEFMIKVLRSYDQWAERPIEGARDIIQMWIDGLTSLSKMFTTLAVTVGTAAVGWIPFIGDGLARIVQGFGEMAQRVIDFAYGFITALNEAFAREFQKRADMLFALTKVGASFAGGMDQMAQYAIGSGIGLKAFREAVVKSRDNITAMGYSMGAATDLMYRGFKAMSTTMGKGGIVVRDQLLALGYQFEDQGVIMSQYMAQQRALGVDLQKADFGTIAKGTLEYAKHLKVLTDITGQDAAKLMDQARSEAQRGALMTQLTGLQSQAFQDAYAVMTALPGQQGPKLQQALMQMLAGGVVTDPVIAGNAIIMDMLNKTAQQVMKGNINMVVATQENLADAAIAYRRAGDSATDFATLMNPSGTSQVAQGMSQFGNALREYRYGALSAKNSMEAADAQASAADGLTRTYVKLQNAMTDLLLSMEKLFGGGTLGLYGKMIEWTGSFTVGMIKKGVQVLNTVTSAGLDLVKTVGLLLGKTEQATGTLASKADALIPGLSSILGGYDEDVWSKKGTASAGKGLAEAQAASVQAPTQGIQGSEKTTGEQVSMAVGGVATGPETGYPATLHGLEAVIPLSENRKIPVDLSTQIKTDPGMAAMVQDGLGNIANQIAALEQAGSVEQLSDNLKASITEIKNQLVLVKGDKTTAEFAKTAGQGISSIAREIAKMREDSTTKNLSDSVKSSIKIISDQVDKIKVPGTQSQSAMSRMLDAMGQQVKQQTALQANYQSTVLSALDRRLGDVVSDKAVEHANYRSALSDIERRLGNNATHQENLQAGYQNTALDLERALNKQTDQLSTMGELANYQRQLEVDVKIPETTNTANPELIAAIQELKETKAAPVEVKVDNDDVKQQLLRQQGILTDILGAMQKNNRYTSGILQNSM